MPIRITILEDSTHRNHITRNIYIFLLIFYFKHQLAINFTNTNSYETVCMRLWTLWSCACGLQTPPCPLNTNSYYRPFFSYNFSHRLTYFGVCMVLRRCAGVRVWRIRAEVEGRTSTDPFKYSPYIFFILFLLFSSLKPLLLTWFCNRPPNILYTYSFAQTHATQLDSTRDIYISCAFKGKKKTAKKRTLNEKQRGYWKRVKGDSRVVKKKMKKKKQQYMLALAPFLPSLYIYFSSYQFSQRLWYTQHTNQHIIQTHIGIVIMHMCWPSDLHHERYFFAA